MELEFLKAKMEELEDALMLFKEASRAISRKNLSQWSYWQDPPLEKIEWVRQGFEQGEFYFVSVNGQEKVAMFRLMSFDTLYWGRKGLEKNKRYIHSFVVREDRKGMGIGALILKKVIRQLKKEGVDALRLDCDSANAGLCSYYESQGFQGVGEKKTPYSVNRLYQMDLTES